MYKLFLHTGRAKQHPTVNRDAYSSLAPDHSSCVSQRSVFDPYSMICISNRTYMTLLFMLFDPISLSSLTLTNIIHVIKFISSYLTVSAVDDLLSLSSHLYSSNIYNLLGCDPLHWDGVWMCLFLVHYQKAALNYMYLQYYLFNQLLRIIKCYNHCSAENLMETENKKMYNSILLTCEMKVFWISL
jgi:hypothetical protein